VLTAGRQARDQFAEITLSSFQRDPEPLFLFHFTIDVGPGLGVLLHLPVEAPELRKLKPDGWLKIRRSGHVIFFHERRNTVHCPLEQSAVGHRRSYAKTTVTH